MITQCMIVMDYAISITAPGYSPFVASVVVHLRTLTNHEAELSRGFLFCLRTLPITTAKNTSISTGMLQIGPEKVDAGNLSQINGLEQGKYWEMTGDNPIPAADLTNNED
jgi:hypothetical protein